MRFKRTWLLPLILAGLAGAGLIPPATAQDLPDSLYLTPATVHSWQEKGRKLLFLDVREPDEFAAGHLPEAINIVYLEVASMVDQLPHDRPIATYCIHSIHRAPTAAKILRELGFSNAYVLEGGIVAWQSGGLTLRASDSTCTPTILPCTERCSSQKR